MLFLFHGRSNLAGKTVRSNHAVTASVICLAHEQLKLLLWLYRFVGSFLTQANTVAHFAVLHHSMTEFHEDIKVDEEGTGYRMQHIALKSWNLKQPRLVISVTGGAQDFNLNRIAQKKLMQVHKYTSLHTNLE